MSLRADLRCVVDWVQPNSRVLDLGCGDGELLAALAQAKHASGYGVEIDVNKVVSCVEKGLNVIQSDLESGLSAFESNSFDYVVLSLTIQAMHNIEGILQEMLRVGRTGIVTFPNFGYWENRWQILRGQMPVSETLPYQWYNTPNIHLCTLGDFATLLEKLNLRMEEQIVLHKDQQVQFMPSLRGSLALVRFGR